MQLPPRRRLRSAASPSPAPRGATPARERRAISRTPVPAKYSTSYGSPITQLPDRSTVGGGGNITKAAAEIFTKVKRDNIAAEARRRVRDEERATRSGSPLSQVVRPTIEADDGGSPGSENQRPSSGSEYADDASQPKRKSPRKRTRDRDAEAFAAKEQQERDAQLRRERSAAARARREQKRAEEQRLEKERLEREQLEREQLEREQERERLEREEQERLEQEQLEREQAERDRLAQERIEGEQAELAAQQAREAAAEAMPPPSQVLCPPPPPAIAFTPAYPTVPGSADRPPSVRSFIEEERLFNDAEVQTPVPSDRRPGPPTPRQPAQLPLPRPRPPTAQQPEPASPPSVLKKPPRRPGGTPAPRAEPSSSPDDRRNAQQPRRDTLRFLNQQPSSPSEHRTLSSYAAGLRQRFQPALRKMTTVDEDSEGRLSEDRPEPHPRRSGLRPSATAWTVFALVAGAFLALQLGHFAQVSAGRELFPTSGIAWHGWRNWADNVGQFFPAPLLHPHGVLTQDQYEDLRDFLETRTTVTEAAIQDVKSVLPQVVSVKKDKRGRIVVADEFWAALKDRIHHDSNILTLDAKSRISEAHWRAIEQRLRDGGLLEKRLSSDDVQRIVDKTAPASWERWLQNNKRKVADLVGQGKDGAKGDGEAVVSKDQFIAELRDRLADSRKEVDAELANLRRELRGVLPEVKKIAAAGGLTKADTTALVKQVVDKEVTRRIAGIGHRPGAAGIDAMFRHRVNFFSPGNNALIDIGLSSPTFSRELPPVGSKNWLKSVGKRPAHLHDASQALTPWADAGHCWCAGTRGDDGGSVPAMLAVRLPRFVVPQHVVLEHIDPSATTDPGAMPRDVELWALFDDPAHHERLLDWMAAQFPDVDIDTPGPHTAASLVAKGFALIGRFTYEHRPKDDGVFVHNLSRDLSDRLRAATDMVLVRAVTNHGVPDHTCFYRVRLYGELVDEM